MQPNTTIKVVLAIGLGIGVPLLCWWLLRPPTWRDAQLAFENAMVGGDPGSLERFYDEEELKALKLSKSDATRIAREVLKPTFEGYKLLPIEKPPSKQNSLMTCPRPVMANKTRVLGGVYVLDGPEGPKVQFTFLAAMNLFFIQQRIYEGGEKDLYEVHRKLIVDLTDRGVPGNWDRPSGLIRPWAQLKRK